MDGDESVEEIVVKERAPVGALPGWALDSSMGRSRLAWDDGTLYAAELAGTVYSPPIPLFAPKEASWSGTVVTPRTRSKGTATLKRANDDLTVGGKRYKTVRTTLTLKSGNDKIELTTWFYPDLGILRQEQRSGEKLLRNRRIDFVSAGSSSR